MKKLIVLFGLLLVCSTEAMADKTAAGCSAAQVQAAIDSASSGEIVNVPACSLTTWTGDVTIPATKVITLKGAGTVDSSGNYSTGGTRISLGDSNLFVNTAPGAAQTRVTGFYFEYEGAGVGGAILMDGEETHFTAGASTWRVDHNYFKYVGPNNTLSKLSVPAVHVRGWTFGVIDHNAMHDSGRAIFIEGVNTAWDSAYYGDGSWTTTQGGAIDWGSSIAGTYPKAVYIENNWIIGTASQGAAPVYYQDQAMDSNWGARIVFRYNYVQDAEIQSHCGDTAAARSTVHQEIYENTFVGTLYNGSPAVLRFMLLRGGTFTVYNNKFNGSFRTTSQLECDYPPGAPVNSSCAEPNGASPYTYPCSSYPCLDQIGVGPASTHLGKSIQPAYVWGNTKNGVAIDMQNGICGETVTVEGRDYINGTEKPGYTAYTYPHPLIDGYVEPDPPPPTYLAISKHPTNPIWFKSPSTGKAILLSGSHTWGNGLYDESSPYVDWDEYTAMLLANGHNFIRMWATEDSTLGNYYRYTPSGTKFDLSSVNSDFLDNLRAKVIDAGTKGIYVGITLFRPDNAKNTGDCSNSYFDSANNVNSINGDTNSDGYCYETYNNSVTAITNAQKAYALAVVNKLSDLNNVFYEIGNEGDVSSESWQNAMITYIKSIDTANPHLVWMSTTKYWTSTELNHDAGISANADVTGFGASVYANSPTANTGSRPNISDTDHFYGDMTGTKTDLPWKSFLRGHHFALMDWYNYGDPTGGYTAAEQTILRERMGQTVSYANKMLLADMTPQNSLSTTGYCLASVGNEYLTFQPSSGTFNVTLSAGDYSYEWFRPSTGAVTSTGSFTATSGAKTFSPAYYPAVLYLVKIPPPEPPSAGPVLDNLSPSGVQPCTTPPTADVFRSLTTDVWADCYSNPDPLITTYAQMSAAGVGDHFDITRGTTHQEWDNEACGSTRVYNVACVSATGVETRGTISFSVASPGIAGPGGLRITGGRLTH